MLNPNSVSLNQFPTASFLYTRRLLMIAWMSVILGLAAEAMLVLLAAAFGSAGATNTFLADAAPKISWSMLVCVGLSLGTTAAPSVRARTIGLLGMLSAPAAFIVAKMVHRAFTQGIAIEPTLAPSPIVVAMLKGIEYGALGVAAGLLANKPWAGIGVYAVLGFVTGLIFGCSIVAYTLGAFHADISAAQIVGAVVNELLNPTGCAMILYASSTLGKRLAAVSSK